jgi:glycerol uptake facilitator-like aquaporin
VTTAPPAIIRRIAAEFVGSASLTTIVVGSGAAATNLTDDVGMQLLINAIATAFGLFVLITVLGPLSGAHFNPLVSAVDYALGLRNLRDIGPYALAQILGCMAGCILANAMFELPLVSWSTTERTTAGHLLAEVVATAGLIFIIFALAHAGRSHFAASVVATYIGAAYFFTSSTSFANPAITIGRMFSDTFAGIAPISVLPYLGAQIIGAVVGLAAVKVLAPARPIATRQLAASEPKAATTPLS